MEPILAFKSVDVQGSAAAYACMHNFEPACCYIAPYVSDAVCSNGAGQQVHHMLMWVRYVCLRMYSLAVHSLVKTQFVLFTKLVLSSMSFASC